MLHVQIYGIAGQTTELDFLEGIGAGQLGGKEPSPNQIAAAGSISLDPEHPYPQTGVTGTYRGTAFVYTKSVTSISIGGHTSNLVSWGFDHGRVTSVDLEAKGRPLVSMESDVPFLVGSMGPSRVPALRFSGLGVDFTGNQHANDFSGAKQDDVLSGLGGDDILRGNGGDDRLLGGFGRDELSGGTGADRMVGGRGHDTYRIDSALDRVIERPDEGTDLVIASASHRLARNVEDLTLTGDAVRATGNALANVLNGTEGDNVLEGAGGDDTLIGGAGTDRLSGGGGADVFVFYLPVHSTPGAARDVILDFKSGIDTIDLASLAGKIRGPLDFIGDDPFSGSRGEVRYEHHIVAFDRNGDGAADFEIRLKGGPDLTADDLHL